MRLDPHRDARPAGWADPARYWPAMTAGTAELDPPVATLDVDALSWNAQDLVRRAAGTTLRVASKSVRVRSVLQAVLELPRYAGILAYTLPEANWLAEWCDDIVVGYPTTHRAALAQLVGDPKLARRITLMVDSPHQLDLIDSVAPAGRREEIRVCLELDSSLDLPGARIGVWRSGVHQVATARAAAQQIAARPGFTLVGMLAYEAQVAGLANRAATRAPSALARAAVIRRLQAASTRELRDRRGAAVAAVSEVTPLEFVNGGGTGSLESTGADPAVTEIAVGSGLFGPHLFDHYRDFSPAPAAAFALSVVRKPAAGKATLLGGGWIASGPPAADRLPSIVWPPGLRMIGTEMAGEVQTPVRNARDLRVGDRVWLRHAKAGELSEHVNEFTVVSEGQVLDTVSTYRGEGKAFL